MRWGFILLLLTVFRCLAVDLVLPTENDAIDHGGGEAFYQYVERDFEGVKSYPWQGGQYGFVRGPVKTRDGVIFQRLHEGIDIKPVRRDAKNMPLDLVKAVAAGTVAYVNDKPGASNYGRYIVIRHVWDGCPYFTLYAHLNRADVSTGDDVTAGQAIGLLGFTGDGIDIVRAHLHFEINLFLSDHFEEWYVKNFPGEVNHHGLYNGMNLSGLDVGSFLPKARRDNSLTVPAFLAQQEVFYRVKVPAPGPVELARRYPWMSQAYQTGQAAEISFLRTGMPVKITGIKEDISAPIVSWVRPVGAPLGYYTKNYLQGTAHGARLTPDGLRYLTLLGGQ